MSDRSVAEGVREIHRTAASEAEAPRGLDLTVEAIIFVDSPQRRSWWRNFDSEDGHDPDLPVQQEWLPMRGRAIFGADEPEAIGPLLGTCFGRFTKAGPVVG